MSKLIHGCKFLVAKNMGSLVKTNLLLLLVNSTIISFSD